MTFTVRFVPSPAPDASGEYDEDEEIDDLTSLAMTVCPVLGDLGARFRAGGFGDDRRPVDVTTDLATVVPQIPDLLEALATGTPGELDFYEQGIERTVRFVPQDDTVELRCESYGTWAPAEPVERAGLARTRAMPGDLAIGFSGEVARLFPDLAGSPLLPR